MCCPFSRAGTHSIARRAGHAVWRLRKRQSGSTQTTQGIPSPHKGHVLPDRPNLFPLDPAYLTALNCSRPKKDNNSTTRRRFPFTTHLSRSPRRTRNSNPIARQKEVKQNRRTISETSAYPGLRSPGVVEVRLRRTPGWRTLIRRLNEIDIGAVDLQKYDLPALAPNSVEIRRFAHAV